VSIAITAVATFFNRWWKTADLPPTRRMVDAKVMTSPACSDGADPGAASRSTVTTTGTTPRRPIGPGFLIFAALPSLFEHMIW
jgi:hypothetical protein